MTEDTQDKTESLGEYLRRCRREKNLSVEDVKQESRIPGKTLQAMEADDYAMLPADAFARGFYVLYAKNLKLDAQDVLRRFDQERLANPDNRKFASPSKQEKAVNTMAARPSMTTGATLAFSLVVIVAAIALFSWYFHWNPATFISSKLQNLQEASTEPQGKEGVSERGVTREQSTENLAETNYFLTIDFLEDTAITIAVDGSLPEKEAYTEGSTRSWYADESISLILPESAEVVLFFNGTQLGLPEPENGFITLDLP